MLFIINSTFLSNLDTGYLLEEWSYLYSSTSYYLLKIAIYCLILMPVLFFVGIITGCLLLKNPLSIAEIIINNVTSGLLLIDILNYKENKL